MPTALWIPIIGVIGTIIGACVVGLFNRSLRRIPEKKSESEERVSEFQVLMDVNKDLREELQEQIKSLVAHSNDQSAQIRILKGENRRQAAQLRTAEQREEILLAEVETLKNKVRALEEELRGRAQ